jgi:RNA polymerase sigma-70 factor (ECF subfamily)
MRNRTGPFIGVTLIFFCPKRQYYVRSYVTFGVLVVSYLRMENDRDLFWRLLRPEHIRARAFCRKLTGNREDGDDLYQDALVSALLKFGDIRDSASFRPWLYRTVINTFKNRVRRPWWSRVLPLTTEIEETIGSANPLDAYAARRRLERAFRAISTYEKSLVILFELEGWTIRELAELFGKRQSAIKTRLCRTRRKMRDALAKVPGQKKLKPTVAASEEEICVVTKSAKD